MALADGIRRNIAKILEVERDRFINAWVTLDTKKVNPLYHNWQNAPGGG